MVHSCRKSILVQQRERDGGGSQPFGLLPKIFSLPFQPKKRTSPCDPSMGGCSSAFSLPPFSVTTPCPPSLLFPYRKAAGEIELCPYRTSKKAQAPAVTASGPAWTIPTSRSCSATGQAPASSIPACSPGSLTVQNSSVLP